MLYCSVLVSAELIDRLTGLILLKHIVSELSVMTTFPRLSCAIHEEQSLIEIEFCDTFLKNILSCLGSATAAVRKATRKNVFKRILGSQELRIACNIWASVQ